jgi:MoxR-like ATPase
LDKLKADGEKLIADSKHVSDIILVSAEDVARGRISHTNDDSNIKDKDNIKKKCKDLHFKEKKLISSEIPRQNNYNVAALCGLKDILSIFEPGDPIIIVDCETGKRYDTHIHPGRNDMINAGLRNLWKEDDRYKKFRPGDIIGIALDQDPENNHKLYVCFKYQDIKKAKGLIKVENKEGIKMDNDKKEQNEENNGKSEAIKDYTFATIKGFQLRMLETGEWSEECPCQYFNDVPPKLCEILIDRHKDFNIEDLNKYLSRTVFYRGRRGTNPKQIIGTDIFVETNFDNNTKFDLCLSIIKYFGYTNTDLSINLQVDKKDEKNGKMVNENENGKIEGLGPNINLQEDKKDEKGGKMDKKEEVISEDIKELQRLKEIVGPEEFTNIVNGLNDAAKQKIANDERNAEIAIIAEEQRIKEDEEKKRFLEKEKERKAKIDKNLENLSADAKKAIKNGTLFLEGPPGTSKSYDAEKIVCEIENAYIVDKEKDFTFEELKDMGFVDRIELDSSWSNSDLMGGMTYYTEEEDKKADNIKPISKSGILTRMNKRNIGLALKLGSEEIESNTTSKIFTRYKEIVGDKKIYEYAMRHILLVEEASRGNFESIFGGNMTILERERRLGEDNQTYVTNRSGYCRALAPSMIVICTRNIADRGSKNIDIGIMRRFPRIYKGPDFKRIENYMNENKEKLKYEGIYECMELSIKVLSIINSRISSNPQFGIDYQIGHTYLYVKTQDEFISEWTNWILPSILDRCNRKFDVFNDILFGEERSESIDRQKCMPVFKNIEELGNFISEIIGSGKNE